MIRSTRRAIRFPFPKDGSAITIRLPSSVRARDSVGPGEVISNPLWVVEEEAALCLLPRQLRAGRRKLPLENQHGARLVFRAQEADDFLPGTGIRHPLDRESFRQFRIESEQPLEDRAVRTVVGRSFPVRKSSGKEEEKVFHETILLTRIAPGTPLLRLSAVNPLGHKELTPLPPAGSELQRLQKAQLSLWK